ncbi:MAG: homoprotocatechuate degradation regulator HpaR [Ascidiaceihabitans sp.]|jgi:homoprotocatechuate degradation regulator HpaR
MSTAMTSPKLRQTTRSLPIALLRARETIMEPVREMLSRSQISEQKWRILRVVEEIGPVEQTVIAKRACLLLPSLTRLMHAMETDGLLTRVPSTTDRRKSIVSITDSGRALIDEHSTESVALFDRIEQQFGSQRLEDLLDLLEELQDLNLTK